MRPRLHICWVISVVAVVLAGLSPSCAGQTEIRQSQQTAASASTVRSMLVPPKLVPPNEGQTPWIKTADDKDTCSGCCTATICGTCQICCLAGHAAQCFEGAMVGTMCTHPPSCTCR
jgi:hypothetical protein